MNGAARRLPPIFSADLETPHSFEAAPPATLFSALRAEDSFETRSAAPSVAAPTRFASEATVLVPESAGAVETVGAVREAACRRLPTFTPSIFFSASAALSRLLIFSEVKPSQAVAMLSRFFPMVELILTSPIFWRPLIASETFFSFPARPPRSPMVCFNCPRPCASFAPCFPVPRPASVERSVFRLPTRLSIFDEALSAEAVISICIASMLISPAIKAPPLNAFCVLCVRYFFPQFFPASQNCIIHSRAKAVCSSIV